MIEQQHKAMVVRSAALAMLVFASCADILYSNDASHDGPTVDAGLDADHGTADDDFGSDVADPDMTDSGSDVASHTPIPSVWPESTPEAQGIHPDLIDEIGFMMKEDEANGVLIKNGYLVAAWDSVDTNTKFEVQSINKSFVSFMLGMATKQGLLPSVDAKVVKYHPDFEKLQLKYGSEVTFRQLTTMTAGIYPEAEGPDDPPGTSFLYVNLQNVLLSDALSHVFGRPLDQVLAQDVFPDIGNPAIEIVDLTSTFRSHPLSFYGIRSSARDLARFAQIFNNQGWANSNQLVTEAYSKEAFTPIAQDMGYDPRTDGQENWAKYTMQEEWIPYHTQLELALAKDGYFGYGFNWWYLGDSRWSMAGRGLQFAIVWPEHNMILVKLNDYEPQHKHCSAPFLPLLKAAVGDYALTADSPSKVHSFKLSTIDDAEGHLSGSAYCAKRGLTCLSVDWLRGEQPDDWLGFESDSGGWYSYSCKNEVLTEAQWNGTAKVVNCTGPQTSASYPNELHFYGVQIGANAHGHADSSSYCSSKGLTSAGVDWLYAENGSDDAFHRAFCREFDDKWWCRFGTTGTLRTHFDSTNEGLALANTDDGRKVYCVGERSEITDETHMIHSYYFNSASQIGSGVVNGHDFCWQRGMSCLGVEWLYGEGDSCTKDQTHNGYCTYDELQDDPNASARWKQLPCDEGIKNIDYDNLVRVINCRPYPVL